MKRRDIEKQLKKEAQAHTPEVYDNIVRSARAEGLLPDETETSEVRRQGHTAVAVGGKKRFVPIVFAFFAVVACLAIVLPIVLKGRRGVPPVPPKHIVLSSDDVYGMGAVSTVKLLGVNMSARALGRLSANVSARNKSNGANDIKAHAKKFNEYFTALDCFMGEEIVTTVSEKNTDVNYPYETKLTINSKNFNGEAVRNVMYFTETLMASDEYYDDEEETEYRLTGILVVDGVDFDLEGARAVESDDDEVENELMIRAYADISDKSNYVEMVQVNSVENGETETEYVYGVYSNGECVEQTAIEFETEIDGNSEETEYELEFRSGEARGRYVVERETVDGKVRITVEYDIDGEYGEFYIESVPENGYRYSFSDGTTAVF